MWYCFIAFKVPTFPMCAILFDCDMRDGVQNDTKCVRMALHLFKFNIETSCWTYVPVLPNLVCICERKSLSVASHKHHGVSCQRPLERLSNSLFRLITKNKISAWGIRRLPMDPPPQRVNYARGKCFHVMTSSCVFLTQHSVCIHEHLQALLIYSTNLRPNNRFPFVLYFFTPDFYKRRRGLDWM